MICFSESRNPRGGGCSRETRSACRSELWRTLVGGRSVESERQRPRRSVSRRGGGGSANVHSRTTMPISTTIVQDRVLGEETFAEKVGWPTLSLTLRIRKV
eukprot:1817297-Rhodomonas_salina.1